MQSMYAMQGMEEMLRTQTRINGVEERPEEHRTKARLPIGVSANLDKASCRRLSRLLL